MKPVLLTFLLFIVYPPCFSQQSPTSQSNAIRQLYNRYLEAENDGDVNQLKQVQKKAQAFLQKKNDLSNQEAGLLYTIDGDAWLEAGEYATSLPLLLKADSLCALCFTPSSPEALQAKRILSWSYGYNGHPELERKLSYELLTIYSADKQKNSLEIADLYHTIGFNFGNEGNRPEEQKLYKQGLNLMENFTPKTTEQKQGKLYTLGLIYNSISISQYANNQYEAALQNARTSLYYRNQFMPGSPQLATNWMIIGRSLYHTEGSIDSALIYLDTAIALLEKKDEQSNSLKGSKYWVTYKGYKADILQKAGRMDEVIAEVKPMITWLQKNNGQETATGLVPAYCSLSSAYLQKGQTREAVATMQDLKNKVDNNQTLLPLLRMKMNTQYALALHRVNKNASAISLFDDVVHETGLSLSQLEQNNFSIPATLPFESFPVYTAAAEAICEQAFLTHNPTLLLQGINVFRNVIAALQLRETWYFEAGIEENTGSEDMNVYEKLLAILYQSKSMIDEPLRLQYAWAAIEASKANLLQAALSEDAYFSSVLLPVENTRRIDMKTKLYAAVKKANETGAENTQDEIRIAREDYIAYIQLLKKRYPGYRNSHKAAIAVTDTRLINHRGVIINYFLGDDHLYSFSYQNGSASFTRKNVLPHFNNIIQSLRQKSTGKRNLSLSDNYALYNWLLGGISLRDELIIIPHKQLSLVSFDMLATSNQNASAKYLIQKCPVHYAYSASLLMPAANENRKEKAPRFFGGFAASRFDTSAGYQWLTMNATSEEARDNTAFLTGTEKETEAIAGIMHGDAYLHANPTDFLQHAADYRVLHIATHAFADNQRQCHFLFENDSANNKFISGNEIAMLSMHADMAVLSACNTGTGKMNNNEGMISLGRSFFVAGCPSVVMSLWSVNDESTSQIMTAFYKHLQNGETKDEALRHAQLDYLSEQTNPAKKEPYYWAGFILVGDNSPLETSSWFTSSQWLLVAVLLLLITISGFVYFRRRSSSSFT